MLQGRLDKSQIQFDDRRREGKRSGGVKSEKRDRESKTRVRRDSKKIYRNHSTGQANLTKLKWKRPIIRERFV